MSTLPADDSGVPLIYETVVPSSLQVSIVTFRPDWQLLERCLRKLALAIGAARESGVLRTVHVALVDNSADRAIAAKVVDLGRTRFADSGVQVSYVHGHANIGYGAAHNLALHGSGSGQTVPAPRTPGSVRIASSRRRRKRSVPSGLW